MFDWQVTATTIFCDLVDDEVTLIITPDGAVKCTGYDKYKNPGKEQKKNLKKKSKLAQKNLQCEGLNCSNINQYRRKILGEK